MRQICRKQFIRPLAHLSVQKAYAKEIKQVGKKVKLLRESLKMTQQTLADECDVDIRTIQRIEKGEFGSGLHILFALASALKTTAKDLLP